MATLSLLLKLDLIERVTPGLAFGIGRPGM
jgi:hypothetical protein